MGGGAGGGFGFSGGGGHVSGGGRPIFSRAWTQQIVDSTEQEIRERGIGGQEVTQDECKWRVITAVAITVAICTVIFAIVWELT